MSVSPRRLLSTPTTGEYMPVAGDANGWTQAGIDFFANIKKQSDDLALAEARTSPEAMEERKKADEIKKYRGRAATMLTGGLGLTAPAPTARQTLLGV